MNCRYKGKFSKKNVVQWKKNVIISNKARNENKENAENTSYIELSGRRLVDLQVLDDELWCKPCKKALRLRHSVNELKNGLASIFHVKCETCGNMYEVNTSAIEKNSTYKHTYTVNSKVVVGVLESGGGNTHLNKILSAAEVPIMQSTIFKRHEKKVGVAIELIAQESCLENLKAEKEMTIEKEGYGLE
ncbi:uncharacterized protein LOC130668562 [Microplitis mediator]|uniref:uncharacterized protein LOC130668562 n=1 Tax=Microplitis mediator TaxID=375433 RepID=UPI0025573358|nr:uncharacterized protein LOC130668562 [Microplitis mediator]